MASDVADVATAQLAGDAAVTGAAKVGAAASSIPSATVGGAEQVDATRCCGGGALQPVDLGGGDGGFHAVRVSRPHSSHRESSCSAIRPWAAALQCDGRSAGGGCGCPCFNATLIGGRPLLQRSTRQRPPFAAMQQSPAAARASMQHSSVTARASTHHSLAAALASMHHSPAAAPPVLERSTRRRPPLLQCTTHRRPPRPCLNASLGGGRPARAST